MTCGASTIDTRSAFEAEMLAHLPKLRARARWLTKDADKAEDLVQDTLVNALRAWGSFTPGTNMAGWLSFICRNIFLSGKRRSWRLTEMDDVWAAQIPSADSPHHRLALKEVLAALAYLPAEQSEALLLIAEGISYEDAAEQLGTEVGTVKSRVSRARDGVDIYFNAA